MVVLDGELMAARRRLREQVDRVRASRQDHGDVALAERVLRCLCRDYDAMIYARRVASTVRSKELEDGTVPPAPCVSVGCDIPARGS